MWAAQAGGSVKPRLGPAHTNVGSGTIGKNTLLINITLLAKPSVSRIGTTELGEKSFLPRVSLRDDTDSLTLMLNCGADRDFAGIAPPAMPFRAQAVPEEPKREIMGNCIFRGCLFLFETLLPLSRFGYGRRDEVIVCASERG